MPFVQWFKGRKLAVATMHGKEQVLGPVLSEALGVQIVVPAKINTDFFGTFSGEIERKGDVLTVLRAKCRMALEECETDLAVASEGSFGLHPQVPFLPADDERVMLMDFGKNIEVIGSAISSDTNYASGKYSQWQEIVDFADRAGFPSHGMILSDRWHGRGSIYKGITDPEILRWSFDRIKSTVDEVYAETDMRAMYNPTRMRVIKKAALDLVERLKISCPSCDRPGYGVTGTIPGLPCSKCNQPTRSALLVVYSCSGCGCREERMYPEQKLHEDPGFCDRCNP